MEPLDLDRQEALWYFLFEMVKSAEAKHFNHIIYEKKFEGEVGEKMRLLQSYYQGETKELASDLDYLIQAMGECYFDA